MAGLKFVDIPVNTTFYLRGEPCFKRDFLFYVNMNMAELGEIQATDDVDGHCYRTPEDAEAALNKKKAGDAKVDTLVAENAELRARVEALEGKGKKPTKKITPAKKPAKAAVKKSATSKQAAPKKLSKKPAKTSAKKKVTKRK